MFKAKAIKSIRRLSNNISETILGKRFEEKKKEIIKKVKKRVNENFLVGLNWEMVMNEEKYVENLSLLNEEERLDKLTSYGKQIVALSSIEKNLSVAQRLILSPEVGKKEEFEQIIKELEKIIKSNDEHVKAALMNSNFEKDGKNYWEIVDGNIEQLEERINNSGAKNKRDSAISLGNEIIFQLTQNEIRTENSSGDDSPQSNSLNQEQVEEVSKIIKDIEEITENEEEFEQLEERINNLNNESLSAELRTDELRKKLNRRFYEFCHKFLVKWVKEKWKGVELKLGEISQEELLGDNWEEGALVNDLGKVTIGFIRETFSSKSNELSDKINKKIKENYSNKISEIFVVREENISELEREFDRIWFLGNDLANLFELKRTLLGAEVILNKNDSTIGEIEQEIIELRKWEIYSNVDIENDKSNKGFSLAWSWKYITKEEKMKQLKFLTGYFF